MRGSRGVALIYGVRGVLPVCGSGGATLMRKPGEDMIPHNLRAAPLMLSLRRAARMRGPRRSASMLCPREATLICRLREVANMRGISQESS
ncbi:MAG: hypothetical protein JWO26_3129 [Rhodospirillales bacterium]|jgi:hypothetical protein|nr:hypothetical protein [Rhodospirillales bacterium]